MLKSTAKISYESKYKLNITDDQKRLLLALKQLNNFFTSDRSDTNIDVKDEEDGEDRYNCYFCNSLCIGNEYILTIKINSKQKYICFCGDNDTCSEQFNSLEKLMNNIDRLSHIPLPVYTSNKSNNMYLSITLSTVSEEPCINFVFDKIQGLVIFVTTTQLINNEYIPKNDNDHFNQMLKCSNILDYHCDDFFPLQLRPYFSDC
jgi:hypothetical protein